MVLIDGANRDLDALEGEIGEWLEADTYAVTVERNSETREYVPRISIPSGPEFEWGYQVGRIANDLRSALDHLVYQLAIANGSDPEKDRTQFPIFTVSEHYFQRRRRDRTSARDRYLAGVDDGSRTIIDGYQPFQRGLSAEEDPLAVLAWLNDAHKHRIIHAGLMAIDGLRVRFDPAGPGELALIDMPTGGKPWVLEDGAELLRIHSDDPGWNPKAEIELHSSPSVVFGERRLRLADIRRIGGHVEEIVGRFSPSLAPPIDPA
jgi:hypothetical protein